MRKFTIIAVLTLGLMQSVTLAAGTSSGAVFPTVSHDFGTVTQGEKVVRLFPFRNETGAPLEIERMQSSASGMRVRLKRLIPAGEEGSIRVEWDTAQVKGEAAAEVIVHFADPAVPPITLTLRGTVKPPIEMQPYGAVFFSLFEGESAERTVTIVNNQERPLNITRVEPAGAHFTAAVESVTPGKVERLRVTVPPDVMPGRYREAVYLHTDDPQHAKLRVGVNVLVKNDLYVLPETMELGKVSLDSLQNNPEILKLLTRIFVVKKRQGEFEIKSIVSDVPGLSVARSPAAGASGTFRIDVALDRDKLKPGTLDGKLRITTDDAAFPELIVPIRGELR